MPVRVNADEFYRVWRDRLSASVERVRAQVEKLTVSPTERAAASVQRWIARLQDPDTQERWATNLRAVSLEDWKRAMIEKGVPRIAQGATASQAKVTDFAQKLINYLNTILPEIERMPKLTIEDSINRVTTYIRRMSQFKYLRTR